MARIAQVKEFNRLVKQLGMNYAYIMTSGAGSMVDDERVKGWVIYETPKLNDKHDFAKWFPNLKEALSELHERIR